MAYYEKWRVVGVWSHSYYNNCLEGVCKMAEATREVTYVVLSIWNTSKFILYLWFLPFILNSFIHFFCYSLHPYRSLGISSLSLNDFWLAFVWALYIHVTELIIVIKQICIFAWGYKSLYNLQYYLLRLSLTYITSLWENRDSPS